MPLMGKSIRTRSVNEHSGGGGDNVAPESTHT